MPRSGKSTYADNWVQQGRLTLCWTSPRVIVSEDDFQLAIHGHRYIRRSEGIVKVSANIAMRALYERGHWIMVDETSTTETSIRRILEIDPSADYVLIDTPIGVCKERAILTNQADLIPVIDRIHGQLEKLKAEGIDNVFERIRKEIYDG